MVYLLCLAVLPAVVGCLSGAIAGLVLLVSLILAALAPWFVFGCLVR
jgi:hypothetical protein